jgi:hypothetical protein
VEVAGADTCTGQHEQTMLRQELPEFVHEREDRLVAAVHDGATADLDDLQPGEEPDRPPASDGASELAVEKGLRGHNLELRVSQKPFENRFGCLGVRRG